MANEIIGSKPWYQSKAVWTGVVTALVGLATTLAPVFGINLEANAVYGMIIAVLGALGVYSRTVANTVVTK